MAGKKNGAKAISTPAQTVDMSENPVIVEAIRELGFLASKWEMVFTQLHYSPTEADPATAARARAVARIAKATFAALVADDLSELEQLAVAARKQLEDKNLQPLDASRYAPETLRLPNGDRAGWHLVIKDVVPEKGDPRGRSRAVVEFIGQIAGHVSKPVDEASEWIAHKIAFDATTGMLGPVADFLAECGIRPRDEDRLSERLRPIVLRRLESSPRPGAGPRYRPREIAQRILTDVLTIGLGAPSKNVENLLLAEDRNAVSSRSCT